MNDNTRFELLDFMDIDRCSKKEQMRIIKQLAKSTEAGKSAVEVREDLKKTYEKILKARKRPEKLSGIVRVPALAFNVLTDVTKEGPSKRNYKGTVTDQGGDGEMMVWENKNGVQYAVANIEYDLLFKTRWPYPKFGVGQDKMFKLLIALCEKQNEGKKNPKPIVRVSLSELARYMGESEENIKKGSRYIDQYKGILFSGLHTVISYKTIYNKKPYTWHGAIYSIGENNDGSKDYVIEFNSQLGRDILKMIQKELKGFYRCYIKEIMDPETRKRQYLHRFYNWLMYMRTSKCKTYRVKVANLIEAIKDDKAVLSQPKKCFELLMECFSYFGKNYPRDLKRVVFHNNKDIKRTMEFGVSDKYTNIDYKYFKACLEASTGIKDIRQALITVYSDRKPARKLEGPEADLRDRILKWVEKYEVASGTKIKFDKASRQSFIEASIRAMGYVRAEDLFNYESNKEQPNAVEYLTKVVPGYMKDPKKHIPKPKGYTYVN